MRRRALLLLPLAALLSGCFTSLSDHRVAPSATVTVSETPIPTRACWPDSDVAIFVDDVEVATGTSDDGGEFAIDITAPADPDSYDVYATCTRPTPDPNDDPAETETTTLNSVELIVEPALEMVAAPDLLTVGDTAFQLDGSWCVSGEGQFNFFSSDAPLVPPAVEITFEGDAHTATADEPQPFGDRWSFDLVAPNEPGTYEITGTCTYQDGWAPPQGEGEPMPNIETVEYPVATVTVVAPEPEPEPDDDVDAVDDEAPRSPAAQPVTAAPAFTG